MANEIAQYKYVPSIFGGRQAIIVKLPNAPRTFENLRKAIILHSNNITNTLVRKHLNYSTDIILNSSISDRASSALISHLKYNNESKKIQKIIADADVSGMFEEGVTAHKVYPDMISADGSRVKEWMEAHDLGHLPYFVVGRPGSSMSKSKRLKFMEKGFEMTMDAAGPAITAELKLI